MGKSLATVSTHTTFADKDILRRHSVISDVSHYTFTRMEHMTTRPQEKEFDPYYGAYINRVHEGNLIEILESQLAYLRSLLGPISESDALLVHAPYAWTIKQVVGHLIDVERVFSYRVLRWASADSRPIIGMEQDDWVANTDWATPSLSSLLDELLLCREANLLMLKRLAPEAWSRGGEADGNFMSVRAAAYCMAGHVIHHGTIIEARLERSL